MSKYQDPIWIIENTYEDAEGAIRWKSNDNVLFDDTLEEAGLTVPASQKAVRDREAAKAIRAYIEAQANRSDDEIAEQRAEARAAMGPGVEMVNVFTGERYTT
jgi:hypothetical protein